MTCRRFLLAAGLLAATLGAGHGLAYTRAPQEAPGRVEMILAHENTSFPLEGRHKTVECASCHVNGVVGGTPVTCESCHWGRRQDDPFRLQLGTHCGDCHTPQNWGRVLPGAFDHERETGFRLEGSHLGLACTECHDTRSFRSATAECARCHLDDYEAARAPDHRSANFPTDCELCHRSARSWQGASFAHDVFPLTGQHKMVACESCHQNGRFQGTPTECIDCHRTEFESTQSPNHVEAHFSTECTVCHAANATGWAGARFDHDQVFPLRGMHKTVDCAQCHRDGVFTGTPSDCFSCHRADYEATRSPNHQQAGFPTNCVSCHGTGATNWQTGSFDHDSVFPLKGMHRAADCALCHRNGVFTGTPSNCVDCHRPEYDATRNPSHVQAGFSDNCLGCHGDGATSWMGASFDHERVFALRGRHRAAECTQCHVNGRFAGTPAECVSCHRTDFERTTNPNHAAAGFGTECITCHGDGASTWLGATGIDHDRFFPLTGRHRVAQCAQCHVNGRFAGTPTNCIDCHRADYDRTRSPNHAQAGFGTDCTVCHGSQANSWAGATFDHNQFFQLAGKHLQADCTQCHVNGRFAGTPTNCIDCHRADYDRTTNPNHAQSGFSTDCTTCHGNQANTWTGASFNHDAFFQLLGKHRTADCAQCHPNGRYNGTPSNCVDCHRADYDRTRNPNHAQAGFGTDCTACHGNQASSWLGATFDHNSVFPLQGAHRALDCQTCHAAGYNLPRDCYGCHASDYTATRNPDHVRSGFPTSCENCHFPSHTSWTQAVFQHSFPITSGAHGGFDCVECHKAAAMQNFTCIDCHTHEKTRMDSKHREVGGYQYNSQACYACHPNGRH